MKLSNQTEIFVLLCDHGYEISFSEVYPERFLFADKNDERFDICFKDDFVISISCKKVNQLGQWSLYNDLTWRLVSFSDYAVDKKPLPAEIKSLAESIMVNFKCN